MAARQPFVSPHPAPRPTVLRDFFAYTANFVPGPGPGLPASTTIQVQADSDFELQKLTFFADIAAAVQTESTRVLPLVTLQITDQGSGRAIFSQPIALPAIAGDGRIPFILPQSKVFAANSAIGIDIVNFSAATTYNLRFYLIGTKLFRMAG